MYVRRRLRPRFRRYPVSCIRWRHPPFPRRWREPPRRIRCVQTAQDGVTTPQHHVCPVSRSLRSKGRHSDGNETAPPDFAAGSVVFLSCYVFTTHSLRCGCAGRSYPSHSTSQLYEIMGARRTTRTRRVHPASRWRQSRTGMSLPCAPQHLTNLAHSDGKRASRWAHSRLEFGAASAGRSVRTAQPASCTLVVLCMQHACTELAAA
jgi:hypothetical protein